MSGEFLKGRAALITGSVSGIGLGIAKTLAGQGMRIGLHGLAARDEIAAASSAVRAAGAGDVRFFDADLTEPSAIGRMMEEAERWSGGLDILVNNAGVQRTGPLSAMPADVWDRLIAVNLSACFHTMRLALPGMAERGFGRIVNIASVHGLVGSVEKAPYVASKHGLIGLTKVAALEYAAAGSAETGGVTINCICPGWVETALIESQIAARAAAHNGDRSAGIRDLVKEKQPSARMSQPSDIGALALFLCGKAAHNITGAAIPADGGWTAQ